MLLEFPYVLFYDAQAAVPAGICPVCGGELYGTEDTCLGCRRREP